MSESRRADKRPIPHRDLSITRTYLHPRELVWRALTEPALISKWLMQNDFEAKLGHRFTMRTDPAPGFDGIVHCEVLALDPMKRMKWSWRGGPIDTVVEFHLEDAWSFGKESTKLIVEHTGFDGLPATLVSFILGAGNRRLYGKLLPRLLDELADNGAAHAPRASKSDERGSWWYVAKVLGPIIGRLTRY